MKKLNLAGRCSEMDIAPMVASLLNISQNFTAEGKSLPIREGNDLPLTGAPADLARWQGGAVGLRCARRSVLSIQGLLHQLESPSPN